MRASPLLLLGLLACRDKDPEVVDTAEPVDTAPPADTADTDTPADTADTGEPEPCTAELVEHEPRDGTAGIRIDTDVTLTLTAPDSNATLTLATEDGKPIAGSGSWDEAQTTYTFTPVEYLEPEERYTASAAWCTGETDFTFLTANPDDIPPDSDLLTGAAFYADFDDATWSKPPGIGLILSQSYLVGLLFEVVTIDESAQTLDIEMTLSGFNSGDQDFCVPTVELVADYSLAPWFSYDVEALDLQYASYTIPLKDLRVQGRFTYEADEVDGLDIQAFVDIRELQEMFANELGLEEPGDVCDLLAGLGGGCEACDDGEEYCATVVATEMVGERMEDALQTVEQANCHEDCPYSDDNPECK